MAKSQGRITIHWNRELAIVIACFISSKKWVQSKMCMSKTHLRYIGIFNFAFHIIQLGPARFTQQNLRRISKSITKCQQNSGEKLDLPRFSYGYWKDIFVDSLHKSSQLHSLLSVKIILKIRKIKLSISLKHMSL